MFVAAPAIRRGAMSNTSFEAERLVDSVAAAIRLPIAPEHRPGVIANLAALEAMAQLVMDFPLADDIEPAPIFRP